MNEYDFDLMFFLVIVDIMVFDVLLVIFEFVVFEKFVVWCDFYKLCWLYCGIFLFWFKFWLDEDIKYFNKFCFWVGDYNEL